MKIIAVDNFNRDDRSDWLVAENVNKHYGTTIVNLLNSKVTNDSDEYFRLVEDNHELYVYEV